jgi:hypothetical protein
MTSPNRIKAARKNVAGTPMLSGPELTNRADRIWLIMEPGLKNFQPSEMGLLSDFIVAKLCEYRLNVDLETIRAEQERALKERRTK